MMNPKEEFGKIRAEFDRINKKRFGLFQEKKKQKEIQDLVWGLEKLLEYSFTDYQKGDVIENAPKPDSHTGYMFGAPVGEFDSPAPAKEWAKYLEEKLQEYEPRFK